MKIKKLLTIFILLSISFSAVHAIAIDMLDTNSCKVSEYVKEFSQPVHVDVKGDVCHIHHCFHNPYLVSDIFTIVKEQASHEKPNFLSQPYESNSYNNFLKPPITL